MVWCPSFESRLRSDGRIEYRIGHELVDEFLEFASGRARPNTVRAYAHDLSVFFGVVRKEPAEVTTKDVLGFVTAQRRPKKGVGLPPQNRTTSTQLLDCPKTLRTPPVTCIRWNCGAVQNCTK